jgi:hypothetical protein
MREDKTRPRAAKIRTPPNLNSKENDRIARQHWWATCAARFDSLCTEKKISRYGLQKALVKIGGVRQVSDRHFRGFLSGERCPSDPYLMIKAFAKLLSARDDGDEASRSIREAEYYGSILGHEQEVVAAPTPPTSLQSTPELESNIGRKNRHRKRDVFKHQEINREDLYNDKELVTVVVTVADERDYVREREKMRRKVSYFGVVGRDTLIDQKTVEFEVYIKLGRNFAQQVGRMVADLENMPGVQSVRTI